MVEPLTGLHVSPLKASDPVKVCIPIQLDSGEVKVQGSHSEVVGLIPPWCISLSSWLGMHTLYGSETLQALTCRPVSGSATGVLLSKEVASNIRYLMLDATSFRRRT